MGCSPPPRTVPLWLPRWVRYQLELDRLSVFVSSVNPQRTCVISHPCYTEIIAIVQGQVRKGGRVEVKVTEI